MKATRLKRVLAVGETQTTGDREVTLLSLEFYDDGLRVVWRVRLLNDDADSRTAILRDKPAVGDDKNTQYNVAGIGGGSGGSDTLWWATEELTPAVPDDATQLTVEISSLTFVVPLR
jgi:hypothetical protein